MSLLGRLRCLSSSGTTRSQCIKDHYLEAVVWDSIIRSWKGAVMDMARYMGPTTSFNHILWKLSVIFGMVASFDIPMQNFYKVTQGNNEKVPSFTTRLEGTLNEIQLQCPGRMMDLEAQQNIKDCLFHGVCKHICDSCVVLVQYPWYLLLTTDGCHLEGRKKKMRRPGKKVRARTSDNQPWGGNSWAGRADCQINGHPDSDQTGQWSLQCTR